ncbi:MAG TPA: TIGR04086 family membrane protein, partial [Lachnospiraceae bacterium]|nr:TIGR04086 family membrane protein [Lachnospiraceae bacterium]
MNKASGKSSLPVHIVKALIFAYLVTGVILLLLSLILYKAQIPSGAVSVGIMLAYILSTFVGGFFLGKKVESRRFPWGIILGVMYFVIILAVSLVINKASFGSA